MKTLIIIGAGHLQIPLIHKAHQMGLRTIVLDMNPQAEGMRLAHRAVSISTRDIDGCVRIARALKKEGFTIDGVVTVGTDASMAVASIAHALDLPGIPYKVAQKATNKILMREALQQAGLPVMPFQAIYSLAEAREAAKNIGLPAVIKPAENMGSRGVMKINHHKEINRAVRQAKAHTTTGDMILEKYLPGPELSVDALAFGGKNGKIWITGMADRIFARHAHFFIELGHNMPTSMPLSLVQLAEDTVKKAMAALGICHGAAKADVKISSDDLHSGLYIGEIAARLSGGFMSAYTYPLASGVDLYRAVIRIALGEPPFTDKEKEEKIIDGRLYSGGVAIERSICAPAGKIKKLQKEGETLAYQAGIKHVFIKRKTGDLLPTLRSNLDKIGHVVAVGDSVKQAETKMQQALAKTLAIEIDESYGVDWQEVEQNARTRFGEKICWVCKICDGINCASGVPGMGGVGNMRSFQENIRAFQRIQIVPSYIHPHHSHADTSVELFGHCLSHPVMGAPMTGTVTNMNLSHISEAQFATDLLSSFRQSGSIGWLGDGSSLGKFAMLQPVIQAEEIDGFCVLILKPREDSEILRQRIRLAEKMRVVAVGIDIDAIAFPTMQSQNQKAIARSLNDLQEIRNSTHLPFILKGILNVHDAKQALQIGADAIVVSNHGGRVLENHPASLDVLPEIVDAVAGRIPVLVDGGIRSGEDVFKALALGAKAVLVGRPCAIAVVGGSSSDLRNPDDWDLRSSGSLANQALLNRYQSSLAHAMNVCGVKSLSEISSEFLKETQIKKNHQAKTNLNSD